MISFFAQDLPWWNWVLQLMAVIISYIGASLNSKRSIKSFYYWRMSNLIFFALHAEMGLYLLCLLDLAFFRLSWIGVKNWEKKQKNG